VDNAANYTFAGPITGNLALTKDGAGTLTLTGANTFTGLTTVAGGTLNLNGPGSGNNDGAIKGNITIDPGATLLMSVNNVIVNSSLLTVNGTWNMNGKSDAIGYLAGSGQVTSTGGITLDLGGGATHDFAGSIAGGGGVNVRGNNGGAATSTQIFSGTNTYTGTTTVGNGTLLVNGSIAGSAVVNGGMLGGDGTIAGNVTVNAAGSVSAGNSPGHLSIGGNYVQSGTMLAELGGYEQGVSYDWIEVDGTATLGGTLDINWFGGFWGHGPFIVLTAAGGITNDDLSGLTIDGSGATYGEHAWRATIVELGGQAEGLQLELVPEPLTLLALGSSLAGLGGYLRRRRR